MAKKKISKKDLRVVEALLFASEKVLTQAKLNVCFDDGTAPALPSVVETLQKEYEKSERAFSIEKVAYNALRRALGFFTVILDF